MNQHRKVVVPRRLTILRGVGRDQSDQEHGPVVEVLEPASLISADRLEMSVGIPARIRRPLRVT